MLSTRFMHDRDFAWDKFADIDLHYSGRSIYANKSVDCESGIRVGKGHEPPGYFERHAHTALSEERVRKKNERSIAVRRVGRRRHGSRLSSRTIVRIKATRLGTHVGQIAIASAREKDRVCSYPPTR